MIKRLRKPRRETVARWAWKRIICTFRGHDWGMFYSQEMAGYEDICVRCGLVKGSSHRPIKRDNVTDISHKLRIPPPSRL